ncbi:MAG: 50S ribosomal protein L22 [Candidatus Magasanikbacteria bacterium]|nr:50S ribosomal protein L22 [Candidatus Magasanikbacteria bacterium]
MTQEVKAKLKFLKMGPRKVRLVADSMRGHKVVKLLERLPLSQKWAAYPLLKLLKSAVANAKTNFKYEMDTLRVKSITVDGGPVVKRWMPKAHGRATPIRQRTSHINLVLISEEKLEKKQKAKKEKKAAKK